MARKTQLSFRDLANKEHVATSPSHPSITSNEGGRVVKYSLNSVREARLVLTHMQPISTVVDHLLAFRAQFAKIRRQNRRSNDCSRHGVLMRGLKVVGEYGRRELTKGMGETLSHGGR